MTREKLPLKKVNFLSMGQKEWYFELVKTRANNNIFGVKNQTSSKDAFFEKPSILIKSHYILISYQIDITIIPINNIDNQT